MQVVCEQNVSLGRESSIQKRSVTTTRAGLSKRDLEGEGSFWPQNSNLILGNPNQLLVHLAGQGHAAEKVANSFCAEDAPSVMDMLQFHLDEESSRQDPYLRKTCIQCLLHLNKRHGTLPTSMWLSKVAKEGSHPVSGGGFADIWKGHMEDTQTAVCLKVLRVFTATYNEKKLLKFSSGGNLDTQIYFNFLETEEFFRPSYCIVSPWMANGDAVTYSLVYRSTLDEKIKMMSEISEGIRYLHEHHPPIVHSDIKGLNILVSDDGECCLADFGLATIENESLEGQVHLSMSQVVVHGSVPWLAPKLMNPSHIGVPSRTARDIYALGCTIFELLTGNAPFFEKKMDIQVMTEVLKGSRPGQPSDCPDWLWAVVESCWREEFELRPAAAEVASRFVWMSRQREPSGDVSVSTGMSRDSKVYGPTGQSGSGDHVDERCLRLTTAGLPVLSIPYAETMWTSIQVSHKDVPGRHSATAQPDYMTQRSNSQSPTSWASSSRLSTSPTGPEQQAAIVFSDSREEAKLPPRITRFKDSVKMTLSRTRNGLVRRLPWRLFSKRLPHQDDYAIGYCPTIGTIGEVESFDSSRLGDNDPYRRDPQLQCAYEREDMWDDVSLQDAWKNFQARVFSLSM
ncbi:hypothetical protein E1B28_012698 [Marasmius oreades]|uniref:Protein kinase domain-containing protein n=1 Tax=Marasmius oreades TaxID=181124 RepID=A0A9P7UP80_9AGAR|nr:uncharacterized protein E1B28_012698 [Marasmius oreades]KAG7088730.1 hypothetical protein E1B28_012698 [Marasmius oreades]